MKAALQHINDWFCTYVADYLASGNTVSALMELKQVHSREVAAHARAIAESEPWTPEECDIAELLGLLHDIGRFSQLAEFGTFSDTDSVDHGERGFEVLTTTGILDTLEHPIRARILDGVRYHNRRIIPPSLNATTIRYLHAVRDSDKLDIFRVINDALEQGQIDKHPEITLNIDLDGPINPAALAQAQARQNVSYEHVRSLADFGLAQLAWLYDLHFAYSYRQVIDHGILDRILGTMPDDIRIDRLANDITTHVRHQITGIRQPNDDCPN